MLKIPIDSLLWAVRETILDTGKTKLTSRRLFAGKILRVPSPLSEGGEAGQFRALGTLTGTPGCNGHSLPSTGRPRRCLQYRLCCWCACKPGRSISRWAPRCTNQSCTRESCETKLRASLIDELDRCEELLPELRALPTGAQGGGTACQTELRALSRAAGQRRTGGRLDARAGELQAESVYYG